MIYFKQNLFINEQKWVQVGHSYELIYASDKRLHDTCVLQDGSFCWKEC